MTQPWEVDLDALGFRRVNSDGTHRLGRTVFTVADEWGLLAVTPRRPPPDPLRGQLGAPGLWRWIVDSKGERPRKTFDVTAPILGGALADGLFRQAVAWALVTMTGERTDGWSPPPKEELEESIPEHGLTVRAGPLVRQGVLLDGPDHLAIRFPIVSAPPAGLSGARKRWLQALLIDAQSRWRLIRIGTDAEGAVHAEVDLTGAPHAALDHLLRVGLDALRWCVPWIAKPADFLVHEEKVPRAFEVCSPRAPARSQGGKP